MAIEHECGRWAFLATMLLLGNPAWAQVDPEAGDEGDTPAPSGSSFSAGAGGSTHAESSSTSSHSSSSYLNERPPRASSAAAADSSASNSGNDDHMAVVGSLGIGFFGVNTIPIMDCGNGATCQPVTTNDLNAPTIGARIWLHETFGVELGVGLRIASASNGPVDLSQFGLAVHAGIPLALAHAGHFVFEVVPQLNVGFSTGSFETTTTNSTDKSSLSGFLLEAGVKAGAEVHFGFMGLPQLSLQGTLGVMYRHENRGAELPSTGGGTSSVKQSANVFSTGVDGSPWDIFQGAITAIYYFY